MLEALAIASVWRRGTFQLVVVVRQARAADRGAWARWGRLGKPDEKVRLTPIMDLAIP